MPVSLYCITNSLESQQFHLMVKLLLPASLEKVMQSSLSARYPQQFKRFIAKLEVKWKNAA